jgi:hypothetical protein
LGVAKAQKREQKHWEEHFMDGKMRRMEAKYDVGMEKSRAR